MLHLYMFKNGYKKVLLQMLELTIISYLVTALCENRPKFPYTNWRKKLELRECKRRFLQLVLFAKLQQKVIFMLKLHL